MGTLLYALISSVIIPPIVKGQCYSGLAGCELVCHCKNQTSCKSYLGHGGCGDDGCQPAWSGPSCQRENIVYGLTKGYLGSSGYSRSPTKAVDGNHSTRFLSTPTNRPYLWINTGGYTLISTLEIKTNWITEGFQIDVSNSTNFTESQLCHKDQESIGSLEYNVKCAEPLTGQYVRMQLLGWDRVDIYEIEIYGCADYWFGERCDKVCNCQNPREVCDKITGRCVSGCAPGYGGTDCQGNFKIDISNGTNFTDSQQCYTDGTSSRLSEYNVKCTKPVIGKYVRVQLQGRGYLYVYEFGIYRCADYWFGDQCNKLCNCQNRREVCNKITGRCVSGYTGKKTVKIALMVYTEKIAQRCLATAYNLNIVFGTVAVPTAVILDSA